ncbi:MAG: MBL fold metallo-hydrolase [Candidatus Altiarchaeota archaeon]|nr:MBL fold metallo-hydrolase [Candidatus Altiarchaeota archaeon]
MKLTEQIHLLRLDFEITLSLERKLPRFVNAIIIFGDRITLIDTGVKGSEEKIFAYIEQNNRKITDIKTIILSHSHPDHIGSAAIIKDLTNCEVLAHGGEIDWIENIKIQNKERPVPGFFNLVDRSVKVDKIIEDKQLINIDKDITIEIIHSPGHSKGSINILFKEDKILFTADSIPLKNDIPNYDSYPDLMNSLEGIKKRNDFSILLTSCTSPLMDDPEIEKIISDGEKYMFELDNIVKKTYIGEETETFMFCRATIEKLGLPPFLVTPIVDKAFRSHLKN